MTDSDTHSLLHTFKTYKTSPLIFTLQRLGFSSSIFIFLFTLKDSIQNNISPSIQNIVLCICFSLISILLRISKRHIAVNTRSIEVVDSFLGLSTYYKLIKKNEESQLHRRHQNSRWNAVEIVNGDLFTVLTYVKKNSLEEVLLIDALKSNNKGENNE